MKAVVLAAGEGIRLRPLTCTRPKHLIPVGGRPILEHLLIALKDAGLKEVLIILHYKSEMIKEYFGDGKRFGLKIEYAIQPEIRGTADATNLAEGYVTKDFLMVYGDLLITPNVVKKVIETYEETEAAATLAVVSVKHPERYGVVEVEGSHVISIVEKPRVVKASNRPVNAGVYVFSTEIFEAIKRTEESPRGEKEITDSIRVLTSKKRSVSAVQIQREEWLDIGRPWDLLEANTRILNRMGRQVEGLIEEGVHLIGSVVVANGARVRSGAYVEGPVFIGEGSDIGPNCHIRPCTALGKDVRIGNACEVKNSLVMDETHIGHLSYVGDSVIGGGCNIGAGTIIANLRFDSETVKMNVKEETVDSELTKLGAFIGDGVKTGIGSLLMPGVKIGCRSWIGPGVVVYRDVPSDTILILKQTVEQR